MAMKKIILSNLILALMICITISSQPALAGKDETIILPVKLDVENRKAKSGILVSFPFRAYNMSYEDFIAKQQDKLSSEEKVLKGILSCRKKRTFDACEEYFRDGNGNKRERKYLKAYVSKGPSDVKHKKIIGLVTIGNKMIFFIEVKAGGKDQIRIARVLRKNNGEMVSKSGSFNFDESFILFSCISYLYNPKKYPAISKSQIKSLGPDTFTFTSYETHARKKEETQRTLPVVYYFKGQPFYFNILDENLNQNILNNYPAMNFYRRFLKTHIAGTTDEIANLYLPDPAKRKKHQFLSSTKEDIALYRKDFTRESHVRFMIDANPFYLIFFADDSKGDPDKERFNYASIYRTPDGEFKYINEGMQDSLYRMFFKTNFVDTKIRPMITKHFKELKAQK